MPQDNQWLKEYGLKVSPEMLKVQGRNLPNPKLRAGQTKDAVVKKGEWMWQSKLKIVHFRTDKADLKGTTWSNWAVIIFNDSLSTGDLQVLHNGVVNFTNTLRASARDNGVTIQDGNAEVPRQVFRSAGANPNSIRQTLNDHLDNWYQKFRGPGRRIELLMFITPGNQSRWEYAPVKRYCDAKGIVSQGITAENITKNSSDRRFALNILMKINAKLGGVNITLNSMPKVMERTVSCTSQ